MELEALSPNQYTNVTQYFKDYFQFRKKTDPVFSFETWSDELGFKSHSYLRMVCSGDRAVTNKLVQSFAECNQLSGSQVDHLTSISLYQKAETISEKKIYLDKIFESLEMSSDNLEIKDYVRFLSNLQLPVIQLVTSFNDSPKTTEELSEFLNIDLETLKKNLFQLKLMNLVQETMTDKTSLWTAVSKSFHVNDTHLDEAVKLYYEQTLIEAKQYLNSQEIQKRFRSVFFTLNDQNYEAFVEESEAFLMKMRHKFASSEIQDGRLFKVNLFAYPVTQKIKR